MELKIKHLRKQFKDKNAVDDVCLTLTPGVWGLLGANGAGKTTLMRMIAGIMTPTGGVILPRSSPHFLSIIPPCRQIRTALPLHPRLRQQASAS